MPVPCQPLLPQARPFKTTVFAVRIECPNNGPRHSDANDSILPDGCHFSAPSRGRSRVASGRPLHRPPRSARSMVSPSWRNRARMPLGFHPRPGGPGRVVGPDHERRILQAHRVQMRRPSSGPDHLLPAGEDQLHGRRARATRRCGRAPWTIRPRRRPAVGARRRRRRRPVAAGARSGAHGARPTCVDVRRSGPRRCRPAAGTAVVRIDWPGGSSATSARLRAGSSSEKTSSSRRVGVSGGPRRDQLVDPDAQGQGQAPLLALRGVGAGLAAVDARSRSSRCGPTVLTPRRRSSVRCGLERRSRSPLPAAR